MKNSITSKFNLNIFSQQFYSFCKSSASKNLLVLIVLCLSAVLSNAQTCYTISNRTNGNGQPNSCGTNCSASAKTGHIEVDFGASCPSPMPTLELVSVSSGALPNPFCFDAGNCISPGVVRYCFRGTNLPNSGFMNIRLTSGASAYVCNYSVSGGSGSVVLPVTITSFDVVNNAGKQCLTWKVEDESNIQWYTVQYSENGIDYKIVEKVIATNAAGAHTYNYCDATNKKAGLYRLQIQEQSGAVNYSYAVRITTKQPLLVSLYPVPASGVIYIESPVDLKNAAYTIINVSGQKQKTGRLSIAQSADIADLPAGIYFIRIQRGDESHTIKFEKK
jgi:hypothetical protein